jgi:hypothetical protein
VEAKILGRVTAVGVDLFKAAVVRQALLSSVVPATPPPKGPIGPWLCSHLCYCARRQLVPMCPCAHVTLGTCAPPHHLIPVGLLFCSVAVPVLLPTSAVQIDGVPLVVVIIGAGFCGLGVLKNLQQHPGLFRVIIVDQRDYFEFSPFVISRLGTCVCLPHSSPVSTGSLKGDQLQ